MTLLRAGLAALGALLLAGPAPAGGPGPERFIEEHAERLGIDAETRAAIREISEASRERGRELRARIHDAHERMRELLEASEPDEDAVMAQAERIGALHVEKHKNRLRAMLEVRALLTPEQREELVRLREEMGPPPWHRHRKGRKWREEAPSDP